MPHQWNAFYCLIDRLVAIAKNAGEDNPALSEMSTRPDWAAGFGLGLDSKDKVSRLKAGNRANSRRAFVEEKWGGVLEDFDFVEGKILSLLREEPLEALVAHQDKHAARDLLDSDFLLNFVASLGRDLELEEEGAKLDAGVQALRRAIDLMQVLAGDGSWPNEVSRGVTPAEAALACLICSALIGPANYLSLFGWIDAEDDFAPTEPMGTMPDDRVAKGARTCFCFVEVHVSGLMGNTRTWTPLAKPRTYPAPGHGEAIRFGRDPELPREDGNDWTLITVCPNDRRVSRSHFDVKRGEGAWFVRDLSSNGTSLLECTDGHRKGGSGAPLEIEKGVWVRLGAGSVIVLGKSVEKGFRLVSAVAEEA